MSKRIRRRSARALAKKVWNVVLNKDQKKITSRSRTMGKVSNETRRTRSVGSSKDSSLSDPQTAGPVPIIETTEEYDDNSMPQSENHDVTDETSDADKENSSHTSNVHDEEEPKSETVLDESHVDIVHVEGGLPKEVVSKTKSGELLEILNDDTSCVSQEGASTALQPQQTYQQVCLEESNEANTLVEGADVHIIKGAHQGERGIISRVTNKCAFISIDGIPEDVRKTKSNDFLKIFNQKESVDHTQIKKQRNSGQQVQDEPFPIGTLVRIKRGTHKDFHGVISRTTKKCVFISIRGVSKDVRKTKSPEFLEILNDDTSCAPRESQHVNQQVIEESNEVNVFVVGVRVLIVKGKYLGKHGVITRLTFKVAFVSIEGVARDVRKTKSDEFLQVVVAVD